MEMQNFIEYSLPYKMTAKDQMLRILSVLVPLGVGVASIMLLGVLGIAICAVLCYFSYRWFLSFNYELEYTLVEDEIHFAKIINKERRKDLFTADIGKTVSYGPIEKKPAGNLPIRSLLSHQGELPAYFWITVDGKGNKICIFLQPNEEMLDVFATRARGKLV
jgi:hypothetical protein